MQDKRIKDRKSKRVGESKKNNDGRRETEYGRKRGKTRENKKRQEKKKSKKMRTKYEKRINIMKSSSEKKT